MTSTIRQNKPRRIPQRHALRSRNFFSIVDLRSLSDIVGVNEVPANLNFGGRPQIALAGAPRRNTVRPGKMDVSTVHYVV
jgi:hypothetical protein